VKKQRWRLLVAVLATAAIVVPLGWLWQASRMPGEYSVMDMGYADYGGGPASAPMAGMSGHHTGMGTTSVEDLTGPSSGKADVVVELVARQERFELASGLEVDGYTLNGSSPGPTIEVEEGQLLEVRLHNESVDEGITLHWHGVDLPNAEDGVAGVTQDAVLPGEDYTYRFVADDPGTYWYHSHQVSHEQVRGGLLGALVVTPKRAAAAPDVDVVALQHTYAGTTTLNGSEDPVEVEASPGDTVTVRAIATDNAPIRVWAGEPYRVVAVDARDVNGPTDVDGKALLVAAGGRADLQLTVPDDGSAVRVYVGGSSSLVVGPADAAAPPTVEEPADDLDLLSYGEPAPLGFDPGTADREFDYSIGRRPGFVQGKPGVWWTINGHMWPNVPMFMVAEGDVVRMTIDNHSGDVHPMHLHGHHAVVLSRDGEKATGSPWWFDSLNVRDGESYEIAFVADNPGVWMDHCHNLKHAAEGLVAHLMYEGVTTPYRVGGDAGNEPE
jgi:FtsP/CotA-like multicopper oxidase with cupredoxin domain